ncbi:hypothetical protein B296_00035826 [Ensete ventricosum]|uniref:protein-serine/threonine phosphatase n=1 Tax=Ensete ventricosum TaxID=4639 RepID=A0A426XWC0_ENSVE|nr:hypothetical protein B296_00035826 [Ensete ventricosum]
MGSCLSSSASPATADRTLTVGPRGGGSSGLSRFRSRSWRGRKKAMKEKQKRGGGGQRRAVVDGSGEAEEDELDRVPGRMFLNGASEAACLYTQQGRKGTNQDAMILKLTVEDLTRNWKNFSLTKDTIFCGVFDGHGPYGHMVSKKVRDSLPLKLSTQWRASLNSHESPDPNGSISGSMNSEETASMSIDDECGESLDVDENEKLPEMYLPLKQSFLKSFKSMDKELKFHPTIDCFCSGTTAVTVVKQVWDVLSNKEVVDVVGSAPTRSTAARAVVDCAVRAWRLKFPTSKIDDCAVVCLFLKPISSSDPVHKCDSNRSDTESAETAVLVLADKEITVKQETHELITVDAPTSALEPSYPVHSANEIVPVSSEGPDLETVTERSQSTRSLADCISTTEEEEWSALEGITRVNSLLNLPRFLSGDKRSSSWKKWL